MVLRTERVLVPFRKKVRSPSPAANVCRKRSFRESPSLGYAYLVRLVQNHFFNTVFTTNFDDLLNEAFHRFSDIRPIVCAHDSSISSITVTSRRPKIVKLHGDYLFDDIKSTVRETESLEDNTKKKFGEFAKDHGLIVIGYSGHDRSVMDVLQHLVKQDEYFKNGIYWCVRGGDTPSEELQKLLWRERAYWVAIDGFDDLMAELYGGCVGSELPVNTSLVSEKPREMIRSFCSDKFLQESRCRVIQDHLRLFRQELEHEALVESFREVARGDDDSEGRLGDLRDRDFIKLMSLRQKVSNGQSDDVSKQIDIELAESIEPNFRTELLKLRIYLERKRNNSHAVIRACESLIELDPMNAFHYIERSRDESTFDAKLASLNRAIELDPFLPLAFRLRALLLKEKLEDDASCDYAATLELVARDFEKSLELDPSLPNPSYEAYQNFIWKVDKPKDFQIDQTAKLVRAVEALDAYSPTYFLMTMTQLVEGKATRVEHAELFEMLDTALKFQPRSRRKSLELVRLRMLSAFEWQDELRCEIGKLDLIDEWQADADFVEIRARVVAELDGKLVEAIRSLESFKSCKKRSNTARRLVQYLCFLEKVQEARQALEDSRKVLSRREIGLLEREILEAGGTPADHEKLLALYRKEKEDGLFKEQFAVEESHQLLKLGRYPEAEHLSRKILDSFKFSSLHDALLINYELAVSRQGRKPDKARLARVAERNDAHAISMCAYLLMEERSKAAERLQKILASDKTQYFEMRKWAIFDNLSMKNWYAENCKGLSTELPTRGSAGTAVASSH